MTLPLSAADVATAADLLRGVVKVTPTEVSNRLSEKLGVPILLKREDLQLCRSFKVRGAYNRIAALTPKEKSRGVACASAGNHAQGVAYACRSLGIQGTIFLPSNTPRQKRNRISTIGGSWVEQVIVDGTFDWTNQVAQVRAAEEGRSYIHPFDDRMTIAGQGTIAVELEEQIPEGTQMVLVPVGGGGLLAGIATWLSIHRPEIKLIGVEPSGAPSMTQALAAKGPVALESIDSFVDGTAVGQVGKLPYDVISQLCDGMVTVPEGAVCTEMLDLYHSEGIIAEPAGALATAALQGYLPETPRGPVVAIISGGNNDLSRYADVLERSARHEGFRHYFLVTFQQEPGALRSFLNDILNADEDIVHFEYTKKNNRDTGPALVGIELADPVDIDGLRQRMAASPLSIEELDPESKVFQMLI